jgi:hypothetical protein
LAGYGVAQAIDEAAFEIDAAEVGVDAVGRCVFEEAAGLGGVFDVAAEEDDAGGADEFEPGVFEGGEFEGFETDDEEAACGLAEVRHREGIEDEGPRDQGTGTRKGKSRFPLGMRDRKARTRAETTVVGVGGSHISSRYGAPFFVLMEAEN